MKKYIWKICIFIKSVKLFFYHKFVTNFKLLKLIPFLKFLKNSKEN